MKIFVLKEKSDDFNKYTTSKELINCYPTSIAQNVALKFRNGDIVIVNSISNFNTVEDFKNIVIQATSEYRGTLIVMDNSSLNVIDGQMNENLVTIINKICVKEKSISKKVTNTSKSEIVSKALLEAIGEIAEVVGKFKEDFML